MIGPGAYNVAKALPPPPTLPVSSAVAKINGEIEPPIKQMKMKLKETA
jgi:hypothetical protein